MYPGKKGKTSIFQGKKSKKLEKADPSPATTASTSTNGTVDQDLLDAAEQGDLGRVRTLVDTHKDDPGYINYCDKMGASALHCAAMGPHIDVCEFLIHEGASVTVTNAESTTPLHYIVRKAPKKAIAYDEANPPAPLSLSDMVSGRRTPYIRLLDLMLDKGASIDAQSIRAETPLHQACTRSNEEAVRWLLANGAELHITNKMRETPLATLRGQECLISELLELADTEDSTPTTRGLLTWGFGGHGMLGYNVASASPDRSQPTPKQAPDSLSFTPLNDRTVTNVACGSYVTSALTSSEEVFVWGRGRGSSVSGADHWYLLGNGQENDEVTPVLLSLPPIAKISLGVNHGAVVTQDGGLMTWGFGGHGQLGRGDKKNLSVPTIIPISKKITQVVCCETHTIALSEDGTVWTWGGGDHGQLGHGDVAERLVPTKVIGLDTVIEIAGASSHSAAVTATGSVYTWGTLSSSNTPVYSPTLVSYFDERDIRISHIACGFNLTVAVSELGDTYTWGGGRQLGHTDSTSETTPRLVDGLKDKSVRRVSCGSLHLMALTDRGHVYTVGKDSFGQCGIKPGELISNPTRVTSAAFNNGLQATPLHNVVSLACGERHTACVVDVTRSLRDKYIWKILEILRSLLRSLNAIVELYHLPLRTKHGHTEVRAKMPSNQPVPFVTETDINTIFKAVEPLIRFNSQLLHEFERVLDFTLILFGLGVPLLVLATCSTESWTKSTLLNILTVYLKPLQHWRHNSPQVIGYLHECKKLGDTLRKSEPYEEESRDMDLSPLLLEPYFVYDRFCKLMAGIKSHTPPTHPDRSNISKALQHLTRIRAVKDSMIAQDSKLGKPPSVRTLNAQLDGLTEYKNTCKQLYKRSKKIANLERSLAEERASFASLLSLLRPCLGPDESNLSSALEAYSDLERRLGIIHSQNANKLMDNFALPMQQLVVELDTALPQFATHKKAADEAYNDYVSNLGKLLTSSKSNSKLQVDPKKAAEAEKDVQQKKRHLDAQAGELASRLKVVTDKKEVVQWAFLRAMRSESDSLVQAVDRVQPMLPHMDTLEIILREKVRKEWGQHLAASVYSEMASLPVDFTAETDSSILAQVMTKLDEPITLGGATNFGPNFIPLVDLLAVPSLSVVNSLVVTAEDEQDAVLRSVVRVLDAYQKAIPLIKRGITVEVEATVDPGTLFRLNSIATRLMSAYTRQTGTPYLVRTLRPFITEILASGQGYEVDPMKLPQGENVEDNMARLLATTQKILDTIVRSAPEFPLPLRVLSSHLMREVAKKFPASRLTAVGGFIFLRFIGPALLAPGAHGLLDTTQHDGCCRAFILISKVLQNLSNGIEFSKEAYMLKANQFITSNLEKVRGFFEAVASLPATHPHPPTITTMEDVTSYDLRMLHQVLVKNLTRIIKSLAQYKHKDAIPRLWEILTDLGDPNNAYTNPSSSPSSLHHPSSQTPHSNS